MKFITGIGLAVLIGLLGTPATAQIDLPRRPFVNYTELGGLFGRVAYTQTATGPDVTVENKVSFTAQTFNGVQLTRQLAVGGVVGIDWYRAALLMPVGAGIRFDFVRHPRKNVRLFGMADAGYGFAWLHQGSTGYETNGGLMLNPGLGLRLGRPASSAFILTVGYKRQYVFVQKPISGDVISRNESRLYNRLTIRAGVSF
ncbi:MULTISPECIES: hypothetical protein [Spirosoma]|uniref:Outer membrane protein beta-barrel domain-containing protein n=1 Tax=Spirosoma sordidisoli TaxID=2502893 RepID=A0A4Q2ULB4_9BACT|nr:MULTISPECIES: hypothetical protein [Spirosoma]RYC68290.1 hypothetical protein EQG79_18155 [Spirosoma sordidisoli]